MFAEVKELMTFIEGDEYDGKIIAEIKACALDLTTSAEIVLPGIIDISRTWEEVDNPLYQAGVLTDNNEPEKINMWVIEDNSTVTDDLIIKTIAVWCNKEIGNPPNFDKLQSAYNSLKGQLRLSKRYSNYEGAET